MSILTTHNVPNSKSYLKDYLGTLWIKNLVLKPSYTSAKSQILAFLGPKLIGAQTAWGPKSLEPKLPGAQTAWGPNCLGPKLPGAETAWGPKLSGSTPGLRVWFQGDLSKKENCDEQTNGRMDGRTDRRHIWNSDVDYHHYHFIIIIITW